MTLVTTMWVSMDPDEGDPETRLGNGILPRPRGALGLRVWMASDQDHPQTRTGGSCGRPESTRRASMVDGGWGTNRCLMMEWTCQRSFGVG
jgi:hypothetical protein